MRYDRGTSTPIGPAIEVDRIKKANTLTLSVTAAGPHLLVQLFDHRDKRIAFLSARDTHHASGLSIAPDDALELTTQPFSCKALPEIAPDTPELFATLDTDDHQALPTSLQGQLQASTRKHTTFSFPESALPHLLCEGHTLHRLHIARPWRFNLEDPELYRGNDAIHSLLQELHRKHPNRTRLEILGRTHDDRPLLALFMSHNLENAQHKPTLFLNGGHHGNEPLAPELVLDAITHLLDNPDNDPALDRILEHLVVVAVPLVNPDGHHDHVDRAQRAGRKNGRALGALWHPRRGVDLNRNYPFQWGALGSKGSKDDPHHRKYRGPEAASEPEVQAIIALANAEHFVASLSYHTGTAVLLAPYTIDNVEDPEPNEAWLVAEHIAAQLPPHPLTDKKLEVHRKLYAVDGTDQDWLRHTHGTVALLLEASPRSPTEPDLRARVLDAMRPAFIHLALRFIEGPALTGRVLDARGYPVRAEVRLDAVTPHANEHWTTRCRDGLYARYLPEPGTTALTVLVEGHPPITQSVDVTGLTSHDIQLPFEVEPEPCAVLPAEPEPVVAAPVEPPEPPASTPVPLEPSTPPTPAANAHTPPPTPEPESTLCSTSPRRRCPPSGWLLLLFPLAVLREALPRHR